MPLSRNSPTERAIHVSTLPGLTVRNRWRIEGSRALGSHGFFWITRGQARINIGADTRGATLNSLLYVPYDNGEGVTQDYAQAVEWYRKAAEQGHAAAQNNLGAMYKYGDGVLQDNVYAHMWANIAASLGSEKGKENRDNVAKKMTAEQIAEAQKLARECVNKNYKGC